MVAPNGVDRKHKGEASRGAPVESGARARGYELPQNPRHHPPRRPDERDRRLLWPSPRLELVIDNPEGAARQYDAIQTIARKRQADDWELQVSYTWSRTAGTIPDQEGSNATLGPLGPSGFGAAPGGAASLRSTPFSRSLSEYRELKLLGWVRLPGLGGTVVDGVFRRHNGQR